MNNKPVFEYPLFAMGFRVFFALAGLSALALIAVWNRISNGALHIDNYFPVTLWHAHEMLLGFTSAVLAGILLTALKNTSKSAVINSDQLAVLSFVWIYGRVVPFYSDLLPDILIAGVDFAFLPLLVFWLIKPILNTGSYKYFGYLLLVSVIAVGNALIHAQVLSFTTLSADLGVNLQIALIVIGLVFSAGWVLPSVMERSLSGVIYIQNPLLDVVAVASSIVAFICLILDVTGFLLALTALIALVINAARLATWFDRRILFVPLLWVLYLGYAWLILGFGLLVLAAYQVVTVSLALHAFAVGGIAAISLGLMSRLALGQAGRALKASNVMAIAFILINIAAVFLVLLPAVLPDWYSSFVVISSYSWLAAFSLFVVYYAPSLTESEY
jgi:uncharacterized protein involved in response to NO